jgi:probable phosphoglycerate mutase
VAPLARLRGVPVVTTPRLRERAMGVLTGLTFEEAKKRHPDLWREVVARSHGAAPPGGESHEDLRLRVGTILDELALKHRGGTVMIGSHGVAINHMLRHLMGVHDHGVAFWFAVDNASLSRVDLMERQGVVAPRLTYANRVVSGFGEG